ncbi:MAG: hypothetical protein ACM3ML_26755 [Micromonosporaceae bacterium]
MLRMDVSGLADSSPPAAHAADRQEDPMLSLASIRAIALSSA